MQIYRPIKSNRVTQGFGENKACVLLDKQGMIKYPMSLKPINSIGLCPDGYYSIYKAYGMRGHNGLDIKSYTGEPIYFSCDASVEWYAKNEIDGNGGIGVDIISKEKIDGEYLKFRFWHLQKSAVINNEKVVFGQLIGYADNTGISTASHLHWSMKQCEPNGTAKNNDNGYLGAIQFDYQDVFVLDVIPKLKLKIVANNIKWPSFSEKIEKLKDWFLSGKIRLDIELDETKYVDVPFAQYGEHIAGVDNEWYNKHISSQSTGFDIVLLLLPISQWKGGGVYGLRTDREFGIVELQIGSDENMVINYPSGKIENHFLSAAKHEICHAIYTLIEKEDKVHDYLQDGNFGECFKDFDFSNIKTKQQKSILEAIVAAYRKIINLLLK